MIEVASGSYPKQIVTARPRSGERALWSCSNPRIVREWAVARLDNLRKPR